jgi:hypothetical protein
VLCSKGVEERAEDEMVGELLQIQSHLC